MDSQFWQNVDIGLVSGLLASLIVSVGFWLFLSTVRPRVSISRDIARTLTPDGIVFRIKIVNKSRFPAVDVQLALYRRTRRNVAGGEVYGRKELVCESSSIPVLPRYRKRDAQAEYALRIKVVSDLDSEWDDDASQSLRLSLFARHGLSGAFKSFHQDYHTRNAIKDGNFFFGNRFDIEPPPPARQTGRAAPAPGGGS
jgi:hypothetical protein